jgi:nucleotide-binding universal stress UspA family protein
MFSHILVGLDGSARAEQSIPYVEAIAEKFVSKVTLIHVVMPRSTPAWFAEVDAAGLAYDPNLFAEEEEKSAKAYLADIVQRLVERGIAAEWEAPEGHPADVIVDRARGIGADLIVGTTHGRGGVARMVRGSTAEAILHHAECPVLLLRTHDQ